MTKLKEIRTKRKLTQKELSDMSKVNWRQIQRVENGEAKIENLTAKNLIALADALKVDPRELLENENADKTESMQEALDILGQAQIPPMERMEKVVNNGLLPDRVLHEFASRRAEDALSKLKEPNSVLANAIETKRKWLRGKASEEERAKAQEESNSVMWKYLMGGRAEEIVAAATVAKGTDRDASTAARIDENDIAERFVTKEAQEEGLEVLDEKRRLAWEKQAELLKGAILWCMTEYNFDFWKPRDHANQEKLAKLGKGPEKGQMCAMAQIKDQATWPVVFVRYCIEVDPLTGEWCKQFAKEVEEITGESIERVDVTTGEYRRVVYWPKLNRFRAFYTNNKGMNWKCNYEDNNGCICDDEVTLADCGCGPY